jgi:PAS domain S-box-containing protein
MTAPGVSAAQPLKVLLIEDSNADADHIVQELRRAGYAPEFRRVVNAAEMSAALSEQTWELLLCKNGVPDLPCETALALLRQRGVTAPLLLVSATAIDEAALEAIKSGARDIIMKDRLSRLAHAVERELEAARNRVHQQALEEAVQRGERRFRALIEHSFDAICLLDAGAHFLYASPSAERLLGYDQGELLGRNGFELVVPEDRYVAERRLAEVMAVPGKTGSVQIRVVRKDGAWIWTEQVGTNLLHEPSVGGVVVNFRDITARKRFEQMLRDNEERAQRELAELEHVYHTAPVGLCLIGTDLRYLRINERLATMNNLPAHEHLGRTLWEIMPDLAPFVVPLLDRILESGQPVLDWQFRTKPNGPQGQRDFLASYYPVKTATGKTLGIAAVVQEITELKRVERALRESEQRFRALIENSADGFVLLDPRGAVLYSGPRILGYENQELKGRTVLEIMHPDDRARVPDILNHLMERPGRVVTSECRLYAKDGSWRWIEAVAKNLLNDSVIAGIVVNYRDVTDRKRMEEQLRQTQKLESIGVLAGGVAHDFNNLLTGMLGNATLALDTLSPAHPGRPRIEEVISAAESAAHLTRQLLAYSGRGRFIIQPVNLSELTRNITALVRTSIPRHVELRFDLAADLPAVQGDPGQLQQLIMNLVINGAESVPDDRNGSVLLVTRVRSVDQDYISNTFASPEIQAGTFVALEVRDTGCGMDEQTQSKIFDPFFTTKFSGRGLGLSAVLGIVRGHKGAIKVYSVPGEGTTLQVLLPATARVVSETPPVNPHLRGTGTILVADDEPVVRRAARSALERQGFTVIEAANGQEAVDLFREMATRISLVLLDLTMPLAGGELALPALCTLRPDVKIVLSSGFNQAEAVQRFAPSRLAGFLQKPYTATQLAETIKAVLERA